MANSATAKKMEHQVRPRAPAMDGFRFGHRRSIAENSVSPFNLPHPFAALPLSANDTLFWYAGNEARIVAVFWLSSVIRGFISKLKRSSISRSV